MSADFINNLFAIVYSGPLGPFISLVRVISIILSVILFAAWIAILYEYRFLVTGGHRAPEPAVPDTEPETPELWKEIQQKLSSSHPSDWNIAVTRADALFDSILKEMGVPGANFGERLKTLDRSKLSSLDEVWEAHKLRNKIVHQTDPVLTPGEARHAVNLFAKGLRELEYLQDDAEIPKE